MTHAEQFQAIADSKVARFFALVSLGAVCFLLPFNPLAALFGAALFYGGHQAAVWAAEDKR